MGKCKPVQAALAPGAPIYIGVDARGCARVLQQCYRDLLQVQGLGQAVRESARKVLHEGGGGETFIRA